MSPTIGMGIIVRNGEQSIRACIKSFIDHVDQCVIVKAGESTDKTPQILDELKGEYPEKIELYDFEWIDDFSAARNFSFSKLKTNWLCWCDADDEIWQPENLRVLAENVPLETGAIWFPYHYAIDEFGNPTVIYERERFLRASCNWIWQSRIHETLSPLVPCKYERTDMVIYRHAHIHGDNRKERNFKLLNLMLTENPNDKRVWLYLGHQNFACGWFDKAVEWYLKFGSDEACLPLERYQALCYCSKAFREMKDKQCIDVALAALELFPTYKDAYLELAHSYLVMGDFAKAEHFALMAENKEAPLSQPPAIIFINPLDYTFGRFALLAECARNKGDFDKAKDYLTQAYKIRPVAEIQEHINALNTAIRRSRVADGIRCLAVELLTTKEIAKLPSLLGAIPYWFRDTPEYPQLKMGINYYQQQVEDKPEIVESPDGVTVNIANAVNPRKLLCDLEEKYPRVSVIAPLPGEGKQINTYSQADMEELLISNPGRRLLNLRVEPSRIIAQFDRKPIDETMLAVRMYVGQGLEYWSPQTIKERGCGGSETSAAWLSKYLGEKGCQSLVYAMDNQVWDGVIYRPYDKFNPSSPQCHLFISSRIPEVFDQEIPTRQRWLWAHDICFWDRLTPDRAEKIDCIIALSHWQVGHLKRCYSWLKDAEVIDLDGQTVTYEDNWTVGTYYPEDTINRIPKIAIIGDAIDTARFKDIEETRVPFRFIWCSSPDRGLEELLNLWPLIKKFVPEATLKIFYGWEYFDTSLHIPAQRAFKGRIKRLLAQDGVEWCGRVGQTQLAHELKRADAMLYPPPHSFRETYGIAFLEAQAAGVLCFYRQNGALGETIGDRGIPLAMDSTPEQIVKIVSDSLLDGCGKIREKAQQYALNRDWSGQADKVLALYDRLTGGERLGGKT